jgi:hypothetical protein
MNYKKTFKILLPSVINKKINEWIQQIECNNGVYKFLISKFLVFDDEHSL